MTVKQRRTFSFLGPILLLSIAGAASWLLAQQHPVHTVVEPANTPEVQVVIAAASRLRLPIASQGLLQAVHEAELSASVQGKVISVNPEFLVGGIVKAGQVLVQIEPSHYDLAIVQARARMAEIQRQKAEEQAAALQAKREWQVLGQGQATPLSLHEPQLAEINAKLIQATAELALAQKQRQACQISAPLSGRIAAKTVVPGQFVSIGQSLGRVYAWDTMEARLPLTLKQTEYLQLPAAGDTPNVQLSLGNMQKQATLVRREGLIDSANGLEYWVARLQQTEQKTAWHPGSFVEARIQGRELDKVFVLPQAVLTDRQQVVLVDNDNRLRIKSVNIVQLQDQHVWIDQGLNPGDRIVLSGLEMPIDGMKVHVAPIAKPMP